jgi:hypothetical protein
MCRWSGTFACRSRNYAITGHVAPAAEAGERVSVFDSGLVKEPVEAER